MAISILLFIMMSLLSGAIGYFIAYLQNEKKSKKKNPKKYNPKKYNPWCGYQRYL